MAEINMKRLHEPFSLTETKWRIMNVTKKGDKASIAYYIDARNVMDRLDEVVGPENWSDSYEVLTGHGTKWTVECTLVVNGTAKSDVGEGDDAKSGYSDALKRAAVKFGIFRYGYGIEELVDMSKYGHGYYPIAEKWQGGPKELTDAANIQIRNLLDEALSRLGVQTGGPSERNTAATQPQQQQKRNYAEEMPEVMSPSEYRVVDEYASHIAPPDTAMNMAVPPTWVHVRQRMMAKGKSIETFMKLAKEYDRNNSGPCSPAQYSKLLVPTIDYLTDKQHNIVLSALADREVNKDAVPSKDLTKALTDRLKEFNKNLETGEYDVPNPKFSPETVETVKLIGKVASEIAQEAIA